MVSFYSRLLLGLGIALLAACASEAPPFVAPQERPQAISETPWPTGQVLALAYHDVQDGEADQAFLSVRTAKLLEQLAWLHEQGFQAVSVDQLLAARDGGPALPEKPLLLSFDDGFSSFHSRVLPLLKAYQWPAILAPVGVWMDTEAGQPVDFGGLKTPRERFATWAQIREIAASGLVEIAAHTDALHYGARANPQGNQQPAAATRLYDPQRQRYESDAQYQARIGADVARISAKIKAATGRAPRVWVWPYGAASGSALRIVGEQGYQLALTLENGLGDFASLEQGPRMLLSGDPDIQRFAAAVSLVQERGPMRVVHVDLDYVYDPDPQQMEASWCSASPTWASAACFSRPMPTPRATVWSSPCTSPTATCPCVPICSTGQPGSCAPGPRSRSSPGCRCSASTCMPACHGCSAGRRTPR